MALVWHAPTRLPAVPPTDLNGPDHPSRRALQRILEHPEDDEGWAYLAKTYDDMADSWTEWFESQQEYLDPVLAGLEHAGPASLAVEVSCGTGQATSVIDRHSDRVLATDVNLSMLTDAPAFPCTTYLAADVRRLPVRSGSVALLVGLNAVPHIGEFARVLAPGGQLLWCSSFGAGTPLYVEPGRLLDLFGPSFLGEAGRAGHGEWLLLTRET